MFLVAPWRSAIAHALHQHRYLAHANYLQLATTRLDGRPANRTVVFRGFLHQSNHMKFITDARSTKADQIKEQSGGEVCWYFPNTREQFRITGDLSLVGNDHADSGFNLIRTSLWQELSDAARLQFAWPHPGEPRIQQPEAFTPPPPNPLHPLPNFCLLLFEPTQVDYLELRGKPQNRWLYRRDEQQVWCCEEINP
jgi:pyridoxamine 5'-phosphate oxidase